MISVRHSHSSHRATASNANGRQCSFRGTQYHGAGQHQTGDNDPLFSQSIVSGPLLHIKSKSEKSVPDILDMVQPRDERVLNHKRLDQRNLLYFHNSCLPVLDCPYGEDCSAIYSKTAIHNVREAHGAFADLTSVEADHSARALA